MFILGDQGHYHGRFPWVTASLVAINVLVFTAQTFLGEPFTNGFSLVPEEITSFKDLQGTKYHKVKIEVRGHYDGRGHYVRRFENKQFPIKHYTGPFPICLTLFTSMFLHADLFHLLGNMWFLLIFGRNVECALNHGRFLAFYTACGVCAGLAHVASSPHSIIPCLGASGAISGIMGAYISIHPFNKIKIWFGWFIGVIDVPALVVIGAWFILQYIPAVYQLDHETSGAGVAYWEHVGGFAAGFVIIRGIVLYLQHQKAQGELVEEEPLLPPEETLFNPDLLQESPIPTGAGVKADELDPLEKFMAAHRLPQTPINTGVKAGEPDPYANYPRRDNASS